MSEGFERYLGESSAAKLWRVLPCLVGQLMMLAGGVVAEVGQSCAIDAVTAHAAPMAATCSTPLVPRAWLA